MSIVIDLLAILLAGAAAFALFTFAVAWYENANRSPELLEKRFSSAALSLAGRLVGMESFFLFVSLLVHPYGWFRHEEGEPTTDGKTPILLLHGLFQSPACWLWTKHLLRRNGFHNLYVVALPPWIDMETLTERVARKVDEMRTRHFTDKVHLVGHSMGGIIARYYLQMRNGSEKIDRCVLLGVPNQGSKLVPLALSPLAALVMPGSEFLQDLAEAPLPEGVRMTAVYSRHENIVLPFENARLEGAEHVELAGIGHTGMLYHPQAFAALIEALTEEPP